MSHEVNQGRVAAIYISAEAGAPMEPIEEATLIEGQGIEGDRYANGIGAYSKSKREVIRHLSLIASEAIAAANEEHGSDFEEIDTRRNIITEGIELNNLVDIEFRIGEVALRGVELCTPCARPDKLSGKRGFNAAFQDRGGLRAEILSSGAIRIGDTVKVGE